MDDDTTIGADRDVPDEQAYGVALGMLRQSSSRAIAELVRAEETRGHHLFTMMQEMPWILVAHDEVVRHLDDLIALERVEEHVAGLVHRCREDVVLSLEAALAGDNARTTDLGRDLMEIEFLIRDFTIHPEHLDLWATATEQRRNSDFGFGRLAQRQEKFFGLPDGYLTPARREHQAHSTFTHPTPTGRPSPLEASNPGGFLVFATSEILMNHAQRVVDALGLYLDRAGIRYQALVMTPALDAMVLDRDQQRDEVIDVLPEWARLERQPFHKSEPLFPQPPGAGA